MQEFWKILILVGLVFVAIGLTMPFFGKLPFLGKLPGDILVKKGNFTFFAPLATSILVSIILTIIFNLLLRFRR